MQAPPKQSADERIIEGKVASPGLAAGYLALCTPKALAPMTAGTAEQERAALEAALTRASADLATLIESADLLAGEILEFQLALLEDEELTRPVFDRLDDGLSAAAAWNAELDRQIADYLAAQDEYFRARVADLRDLRERVLVILAGDGNGPMADGDAAIYLAEDLTPSRFLETDWTRYRGAALTRGSTYSHTSILARAHGVPLLVGLGAAAAGLASGAPAILDAMAGRLILAPSRATMTAYNHEIEQLAAQRATDAAYLAEPAVTADGRRIAVLINVDEPSALGRLNPAHCDGIGVTRTEFLFYGNRSLPDEEIQYQAYRRLLEWAGGQPVTVRTLDAGGDKPIPGLTLEDEHNPFLGLRGVRLSLSHPDIFMVQLRALARAAADGGDLRVMIPMVTVPEEMAAVRALLQQAVADLTAEGVPATMPKLGMMVEVPAAAIAIDRFEADFFSIGSNDLVQYITASSRDNFRLAALHDPRSPAVLELIVRVMEHGRRTGTEICLCGDMATRPDCLPHVLDAGLTRLSVSIAALAQTKATVARYQGETE